MLQRVLGEDLMRFGLTLYLEKHKYGNANTNDLWKSLSAASRNSSQPVDVKVSDRIRPNSIFSFIQFHVNGRMHICYELLSPSACNVVFFF